MTRLRFPCSCGHRFDLPPEAAGTDVQCPDCRRLLAVPSAEELATQEADGTLKMSDAPKPRSSLQDSFRAFGRRDDLRGDTGDYVGMPAPEPVDLHFDPETGELVTPLDIAPNDDRPKATPVAPLPPISYVSRRTEKAAAELRWWQLPWRLLTGVSIMSLLFVFLVHVVLQLLLMLPAINVFVFPLAVIVTLVMVAHYGNVVEEFGPNEADRVPVLMRSVSISEDVVRSLHAILLAAVVCFWPLMLAAVPAVRNAYLADWRMPAVLAAIGSAVFPAAAAALLASGDAANLLPAKLASFVRVAPGRYVLAWLALLAGVAFYAAAMGNLVVGSISLLSAPTGGGTAWRGFFGNLLMTNIAFAVAIYLTHLAAGWLGLIYRDHYARMNWSVPVVRPRPARRGLPVLRRNPSPHAPKPPAPPRPVLPIEENEQRRRAFDVIP